MRIERETVGEATFNNIQDFVDLAYLGQDVDFVTLKGSAGKEDVDFYSYIALSYSPRDMLGRKKFSVSFTEELNDLQEIYSKVLNLTIPKGVTEIYETIGTDPDIYAESKFYFALEDMPYVVIGLGETEVTGTEAVMLFFASGAHPKNMLSEIQQAVSDHKIRFN